ncbi:MAG: hypothetical protein KZQ73_06565, partial [Candidatus Thiodiazotropha sp. (ex Semelilucina semeliformis)]|nr:hypothetical protein [Candidatus Thiodiazotropha sp. (ex Semelilucina semeliformis)]
MSKTPTNIISTLLILWIFSSSSHALMVCSDAGRDQIFNGPMDGICAIGPLDYQDITELRALRQEVAELMAQEYGGQCRDVYGRDGYVDIFGCTKKKCPDCLGTFYVINYPLRTFTMPLHYVSDEPQQPAACEGDPCDPASGMVFLSETDIHDNGHGLSFTRYYRSHTLHQSKALLGINWRHNYASQLDTRPDQATLHRLPAKYSSYFVTREDACLVGGETIKSTVYSGILANSAISYTNNNCVLTLNNEVVAKLPIKVADKQRPISSTAVAHDVIRPNGVTYHFVDNNGAWENVENLPIQLVQEGTNWLLTLDDQTVEVYDVDGHITHSTTQDNKTTSYHYHDGILQSVTGPFGHTLNFTYTDGRLTGVTGPDGAVSYSYDFYGNLTQVSYPDNTTRKYIYDDFYNISSITGVIDEKDQGIATWEYDSEG